MKSFSFFLFLFALLITPFGCKKDAVKTPIPYASVDIYIYTSNPSFISISVVGGWTYVAGGVRGILIFRKSNTEFIAYDRNCTYQPEDPCSTVVVDKSNIIAKDTCCHSEFLMTDGSVLKAPASLPLKVYNNTFDGSVLHIYN
jgi:nitrite reductase/ring-hydroxylating ferredoxin subunit